MAQVQIENGVVTKTGPPSDIAVEVAKTVAARKVAESCGLFRVPRVLEHGSKFFKATELRDYKPLRSIIFDTEQAEVFETAGKALHAIHRLLELPCEMAVSLPDELDCPNTSVWIHGDFSKQNVGTFRNERGGTALGVLDWQMTPIYGGVATRGSNFFDVAWFVSGLFFENPARIATQGPSLYSNARAFIDGYLAGDQRDLSKPLAEYCLRVSYVRRLELRASSRLRRRLGYQLGLRRYRSFALTISHQEKPAYEI